MRTVGKSLEWHCDNWRRVSWLRSFLWEFSSFDWSLADFTGCDLTGGALGELDARRINLDGVKLDGEQALQLVESLGVIVHR